MRGLITVDVEGGSEPDTYQSVDILEQFLNEIALPTTLFITPDVVENRPETVSKWLDQHHTIGLHIHPARLGEGDSDWLTEYDEESIEEMVALGCETFAEYLDFKPVLFRAGRWAYSERLLRALQNQGFDRDASLRPSTQRDPYVKSGIEEIPLTVYNNAIAKQILRPWSIESIPMHADLFLSSRLLLPGFYAVTCRTLHTDLPYLMISLHDYDVEGRVLRTRIEKFTSHISNRVVPTTIDDI